MFDKYYISKTLFVADANIRYEIFVYIGRVYFRGMQYDFRVSTRGVRVV